MFDAAIISWIQSFESPILTDFFLQITKFGDIHVIVVVGIAVAILLYLKKRYFYAHGLLISLCVGGILTYSIKNLVERGRPLYGLIIESGYSFPSGHTLMATALIGFIIYIVYKYPDSKVFKITAIVLLILLLISIAVSRIYLGVHYPTDVLAGFLLGIISVLITLLFKRYNVLHRKFMKNLYTK
ncbi:MAG TPA: phosphatase PAP2 family protein [Candidatus Paceibacterota bacterium]